MEVSGGAKSEIAEKIDLRVRRSGFVKLNIAEDDGVASPENLDLEFTEVPARNEEGLGTHSVSCQGVGGVWRCQVPAAQLDLKLVVAGFAPHYSWDVSTAAFREVDLGSLRFARGASVAGWVESAGESSADGAISVKIEPVVYGAASGETVDRIQRVAQETRVDAKGFFQFRRLLPGTYIVTAGGERLSTASGSELEIREELEYTLEHPLIVEPRVWLELFVNPATDPWSEPWRVKVARQIPSTRHRKAVGEGEIAADGYWLLPDVEPGICSLELHDSRGNLLYQKRIELATDMDPLEIDLPLVKVRGTLRLGDHPLSAELRLSDEKGRSSRFTADEEGEFLGFLPEEGWWNVLVVLDHEVSERPEKRRIGEYLVAREDGEEAAVVDLRLPDTAIRGRVVDGNADPVVPALVNALRDETFATQYFVDGSGEFEILGLEPGRYELHAIGRGNRSSRSVEYEVLEDREGPELNLVVAGGFRFSGQIVTAFGPAPGALVRIFGGPPTLLTREVVTSPSGRFAIEVPDGTDELVLAVLAPGFPRTIARVSTQKVASILLPSDGGVLWVWVDGTLSKDDVEVPITGLLDILAPSQPPKNLDFATGRVGIRMESGTYSVCPRAGSAERCLRGFLAPNQDLVLDLRSEEIEEDSEKVHPVGDV